MFIKGIPPPRSSSSCCQFGRGGGYIPPPRAAVPLAKEGAMGIAYAHYKGGHLERAVVHAASSFNYLDLRARVALHNSERTATPTNHDMRKG